MAGILNRVFRKDPRSRRRNMKIRTFCVTPLTEDSGLVEWVARTAGFRHCCQEVYILDGRFDRRCGGGRARGYPDHGVSRVVAGPVRHCGGESGRPCHKRSGS